MLPAPLTKKIKQVLTQWNERISRSFFLSQSPFWIRRIVLLIESICHPCVLLDAKLPKCKKQIWVLWLKKNVYSTSITLLVLSCGNLKGHSVWKFFCLVFSQNKKKQKKLTDLKTNFTKFELSTTFCSWNVADKILTDKFDVHRGRLLGNHNDFHRQLGGQINHQPCSYKAARVIRCTELDSAVSSF